MCAGIVGCGCYIFFSSIVVLTPNGNFWIVLLLHSVSDIIDCSMADQMVIIWKEVFVAESRYSLRVYLEVMRKARIPGVPTEIRTRYFPE